MAGDVLARIEREKLGYLAELEEYLRFPSISADPAHAGDVLACAEWLLGRMRQAGLDAELVATDGNPLVYGEWLGAPGKPTVLFYGHYDVQPVDPLELWRHPPFAPRLEGGRLFARGASDDKGQSYTHLKAIEAMLAERGSLPVNVKLLIEGEEESNGSALADFVRADAGATLACDVVVESDSVMYAPGQPAITYGLRGMVAMELRVLGPRRDLHSGSYGGGVQNPANALCHLVGRLLDPRTGRVRIPGFYDDVLPLEAWERRQLSALPWSEAAERADLGVTALAGEEGYSHRERLWARPTCDVNGVYGGYGGRGLKTVLPAAAGAKVSMRLVPAQRPQRIAELFTRFVEEAAPAGVSVEITHLGAAETVQLCVEGPLVEAAIAALEETWGRRPVLVREGGSNPIVAIFAQVLAKPVLMLGFGLADDCPHAPNEKLDLANFYGGIRAIARLLDRLGNG